MVASHAYAGMLLEIVVTKPRAKRRRIPTRESVIRRINSDRAYVRVHRLSARFTPGEVADLECIAITWDTDAPNVLWWIVSEKLAELRGRDHAKLPWSDEVRGLLNQVHRIHPGQLEEGEIEDTSS